MSAAVRMRSDFSASELRRLAATTKNANQSRRLLSLAAILDGMNRTEAARIGGMDRQTLRDWVHRFNECGPDGLKDTCSKGHTPRLSAEQQAELAQLVETGPDRASHGVVRWRRIDLQRLIAERFGLSRAHGGQDRLGTRSRPACPSAGRRGGPSGRSIQLDCPLEGPCRASMTDLVASSNHSVLDDPFCQSVVKCNASIGFWGARVGGERRPA